MAEGGWQRAICPCHVPSAICPDRFLISALRLIRVGANHILGNRQPILGKPVAVEGSRRVLVALLVVRRTVTFHRPLVVIRVSRFPRSGWSGHLGLLATGLYN